MALAKKPLTDFAWRDAQRMIDLGRANRDRSNAQATAAYTDTRASQFVETWANLSAWASGAAPVQVSNGRLYGSTGGATAGINHALNLLPGQSCRIVTTVYSNSSANVLIGIGSDTAGGTFTSGGTALKGLAFHLTSAGVGKVDGGTESASSNTTALVTGLYTVTIWIDANWYTITAVSPDGTQEYRARWARGTITPNNLSIYNGDTAALSGKYVGPISIVYGAPATASPRSVTTGTAINPVEGNQRTVLWVQNGTTWMRIALPRTYDSRVPVPWALMWHGSGSDETHWGDNTNGKVVSNALLAAGIAVIGFSSSTTTPWGAQVELDAGYSAYTWARDNLNLGPGVFYANSMGSISALLALAERRIPGVMAFIGTSPTYDLANNYANATFTAAVKTAYGIASDGSDYAAKTAGHDPALIDGDEFRGVPILVLAASDDTTVSATANAVPLIAKLGPYAPEVLAKTDATGGHSFDFTPYTLGTSAYDIVNFAKRHVGL